MSTDAFALLPVTTGWDVTCAAEGRVEGTAPTGRVAVWIPLRDGVLLATGCPFDWSDPDIYAGIRAFVDQPPKRIWIVPEVGVPDGVAESAEVRSRTASAGRWVTAGRSRRPVTPLDRLGITREEQDWITREVESGDHERGKAAYDWLEKRMAEMDPAVVAEALANPPRR